MKKLTILFVFFALSTQTLMAIYDSAEIATKCRHSSNPKICDKAISATVRDRTMRRSERYYRAYKMAEDLCQMHYQKYCKIQKYYQKKYYSCFKRKLYPL